MASNLEQLGGDLARAIVKSSGIAPNLRSIVNAATSEIRNIYGDEEGIGNAYVKLKLISDGKLKIHHFDYDDLEAKEFIDRHLKQEDIVLNVVQTDSRFLEMEFYVHFLYGEECRSEVRVCIRMTLTDKFDDEFELDGEIFGEVSSLSELNGAVLWALLKS
jgi:hypothetical protein